MDRRRFWWLWRGLPLSDRLQIHGVAVRGEVAPGPVSAWLVCEYSSQMLTSTVAPLAVRALAWPLGLVINGLPLTLGVFASCIAYKSFFRRHYAPLFQRAIAVNAEIAEPPPSLT